MASSAELKSMVDGVATAMQQLSDNIDGSAAQFQSVAASAESVLSGSSTGVASQVADHIQTAQTATAAAVDAVKNAASTARTYANDSI